MVQNKVPVIGLGYQIGVGKDTAALLLSREYGFIPMKFASPLKIAVAAIFGWDPDDLDKQDFKKTVDPFWGISPRTALQQIGTDVMREHYRSDIWVKSMQKTVSTMVETGFCRGVVITDMRFKNEVDAVKNWGGKAVKITRPNNPFTPSTSESKHASELELDGYDDWDYILENDGNLTDLDNAVRRMCAHFRIN